MEISVIVPVYNVEKYLKQCVDSILNQTFPDFELILIDDGSSDGCPRLCDDYARKDSRVRVIHQPNGGLSCARNTGIDAAGGKWLCFVDSDDWIAPHMLEKLYTAAKSSGADMSVCGYALTDDDGNQLGVCSPVEECVIAPDLFFRQYFSKKDRVYYTVTWNKLYKRRIFQTLRFPVGRIHEDNYVLFDVVNGCEKIALTNDCGYYYRQRANSIMSGSRSLKNLTVPEAYQNGAEKSAAIQKWETAAGFLLLVKGHLLKDDYGEGWKKSAEYRALKKRAWKVCRILFPHLSIRHRLTMMLLLHQLNHELFAGDKSSHTVSLNLEILPVFLRFRSLSGTISHPASKFTIKLVEQYSLPAIHWRRPWR